MNNASEQYAQHIETARLAAGRGDRPTAVEALTAAIATARNTPSLHRELAAALIRLGTLKQELGRPAEAERLIIEAIAVGERHMGVEHPSLGAALNELSRLHIRQSNFSRAEPVLQRLLQITLTRGERHPDVATALAGLAVAKRGLGDDAGAELLYRRALAIREEALAPNHMAIVITLEQLAATCAARGKIAEALVHLQRALMRRESALGAEHASVLALHARMADLQRRHAESMARAALTPPVPTAAIEPTSALPAPPRRVEKPAPRSQSARPTSERPLPKPSSDKVTEARKTADAPHAVAPVQLLAETRIAQTQVTAPARDTTAPSHSRRRTTRYAYVGAAVVVLASAGFGYRSHAAKPSEHAPGQVDAGSATAADTPASTTKSPTTLGASAGIAVMRPDSAPVATSSGALAAPGDIGTQPTPASDTTSRVERPPIALPRFRRLLVPKIAMPNPDSVMRSSTEIARDAAFEPVGAAGGLRTAPYSDDRSVTPPVLIGSAPTPRYPDELRARRLEGQVIVRFRVNEKGRVDPSTMQVVQSENELFTAAVRNVLARLRFEPARSGTRDAKPLAAWVEFRTQFTVRN